MEILDHSGIKRLLLNTQTQPQFNQRERKVKMIPIGSINPNYLFPFTSVEIDQLENEIGSNETEILPNLLFYPVRGENYEMRTEKGPIEKCNFHICSRLSSLST